MTKYETSECMNEDKSYGKEIDANCGCVQMLILNTRRMFHKVHSLLTVAMQ